MAVNDSTSEVQSPPEPIERNRSRKRIILILALAVSALVVAGGGYFLAKTGIQGPEPRKSTAEVAITLCAVDPADGMPKAGVTIANHSSERRDYVVDVEFSDGSGGQVSKGNTTVKSVAPGQSLMQKVPAASGLNGQDITCRLNNVDQAPSH